MRNLLFIPILAICTLVNGQSTKTPNDTERVIVDNEKVKVVEFVSNPKGNVCGAGMHSHEPHLTVVLTDADIRVITPDGESKDIQVNAGTAIWFEAETHSVINSGEKPTKMLLIYPKN